MLKISALMIATLFSGAVLASPPVPDHVSAKPTASATAGTKAHAVIGGKGPVKANAEAVAHAAAPSAVAKQAISIRPDPKPAKVKLHGDVKEDVKAGVKHGGNGHAGK